MNSIIGSNTATKANPGDNKTLSEKSIRHQLETSLVRIVYNSDQFDQSHAGTVVPPPNTANLGTEEKAAVFGNRRYLGGTTVVLNKLRC